MSNVASMKLMVITLPEKDDSWGSKIVWKSYVESCKAYYLDMSHKGQEFLSIASKMVSHQGNSVSWLCEGKGI